MGAGILVDTSRAGFLLTDRSFAWNTVFNPEESNLWVAIRSLLLLQDRAGRVRPDPALLHLNVGRAGCQPTYSFWKNGSPNEWTPEPCLSSKTKANWGMHKTHSSP